MEVDQHVNSKSTAFTAYALGLMYASACTTLPADVAATRINRDHPPTLGTRWRIADQPFANGDPNGRPCEHQPDTHRHVLFTC